MLRFVHYAAGHGAIWPVNKFKTTRELKANFCVAYKGLGGDLSVTLTIGLAWITGIGLDTVECTIECLSF